MTYTIKKSIRSEYQHGTRDMYPQEIGPFESRNLAEQALVAISALAEIESATIITNNDLD